MKPHSFDVMKKMAEDNDPGLSLAPLEQNFLSLQKTKHGAIVTIGIPYEVMIGISQDRYCGGLLLVDKERFDAVEALLSKAEPQ